MPRVPLATLASLASLALALLVAGCSQKPTEDVRLRLDGADLVIENRSGADIHHQLTPLPAAQAWVPASLPGNRLESGRFVRWRIAPSQRGQAVELHWWRPGQAIDASGIRGPDRIRRISLMLDDPDPLPMDELAVRACIAAQRAQRQARPQTERACMDEAERCLNTPEGGLCAPMLHGWRRIEREARARAGGGGG